MRCRSSRPPLPSSSLPGAGAASLRPGGGLPARRRRRRSCTIGGGGLAAGVAAYIKRLRPETKVIGVETFDADAMARSIKAGKRVRLDSVGLFADGTAVKFVGEETFRLCRELLDDIVLVDTDAICAAIKDVFEDTRSILEPSGALAIAGAKEYAKKKRLKNKTLVAVASGANTNFDRLRFVAERAEVGEQREAVLAVTIPEKPGSFKHFCNIIGRDRIALIFGFFFPLFFGSFQFLEQLLFSISQAGCLFVFLTAYYLVFFYFDVLDL